MKKKPMSELEWKVEKARNEAAKRKAKKDKAKNKKGLTGNITFDSWQNHIMAMGDD